MNDARFQALRQLVSDTLKSLIPGYMVKDVTVDAMANLLEAQYILGYEAGAASGRSKLFEELRQYAKQVKDK